MTGRGSDLDHKDAAGKLRRTGLSTSTVKFCPLERLLPAEGAAIEMVWAFAAVQKRVTVARVVTKDEDVNFMAKAAVWVV